jgi:hypothetical protein
MIKKKLIYHYLPIDERLSPVVPLGIGYRGQWRRVEAYVDSRATYSLFHLQIAVELGVTIEQGTTVWVQTASGDFIPAYLHLMDVQLGSQRFQTRIGFSDRLGVKFNLLGRSLFFERFEVCFNDFARTVTFTPTSGGQGNPYQNSMRLGQPKED